MSEALHRRDTDSEVRFLRDWAADNKAYFEPEGECGFGRECVGIIRNGAYPDYRSYGEWDGNTLPLVHECEEASPPLEVEDAYHKHECLAVLGRGPEAIHQLYVWVKHLEAQGIVIEEIPRRARDPISLALHGTTYKVLVKR